MDKIKKELFMDRIKKEKMDKNIETSLMLIFKEKRVAKNQKTYYFLKLRDKTGIVNARIFNPEEGETKVDFNLLSLGDFYNVIGFFNDYGLKINKIKKLKISEIKQEDYVSEKKIDPEVLLKKIIEKIDGINNSFYKKLLKLFFDDPIFVESFKNCPSASIHHHNYIGGNLEHTLSVLNIAEGISNFYELDNDLLISGAILHDIGKIHTYDYDINTNIISENEKGKLIGHIIYSYQMINEKINQIKDFPEELAIKLKHLILSHHGKIEWGSSVEPSTPEAFVLHFADLSDSQVKKMIQIQENK